MATSEDALKELVPELQKFNVRLIAEKVETQDQFQLCSDLGFDYFQGYFFCKPKLVEGKQIPTNRLAATRLVAKLQHPDLTADQIEETIRQDVTLSYKLLRFVNSAYSALPRNVDSIGHAAMMIGTARLRNWASLLMLATMDDKPRELMVTGIVRAKMCEQLAELTGIRMPERFFTTGLFSVLDAMLDSKMENVLERLPLSEEIVQALLTREEILGRMLDFTIAYEQGDWQRLAEIGSSLKLDPPSIRQGLHGSRQVDDGNHERIAHLTLPSRQILSTQKKSLRPKIRYCSAPNDRTVTYGTGLLAQLSQFRGREAGKCFRFSPGYP